VMALKNFFTCFVVARIAPAGSTLGVHLKFFS
jgi:hypothetical protein